MISFPHAKINLGLSILSKRPDGFHDLETIFYPLSVRDVLEIVPSEETRFFQHGLEIPGKKDENLVLRAYHLLKEKYPQTAALEIHLYKAIPTGAGLGGGSSDAAEILLLMNQFFELKIPMEDLHEYALELGSDCPFFMQSAPCFASGRGEILEPVLLDLSGYSFLLVHPRVRVETAWAFSKIKPAIPDYDLRKSILRPVPTWPGIIKNDFEKAVFQAHPSLKKIKERLYDAGALYASMTGSGSTVFGIFNKGALPVIDIENAGQTRLNY
jgi:4-diphosphocytidyl-2-C-methyl-D-erythritol kinase